MTTANGKYSVLAIHVQSGLAERLLHEIEKPGDSGAEFARIVVDNKLGKVSLPADHNPLSDNILLLETPDPIKARNTLLVAPGASNVLGLQLVR
jgi:hypothetical protein